MKILLLAAFILLSSASHASLSRAITCSDTLLRLGFEVKVVEDMLPFEAGRRWDRKRFEEEAYRIEPKEGDEPIVQRGLLNAYRAATGVNVEVQLNMGLLEYLREKQIRPQDLRFLGAGAQGALFTHPKLGNQLIKVTTTALQNSKLFGGAMDERIPLDDSGEEVVSLPEVLVKAMSNRHLGGLTQFLPNFEATLKNAFRAQAKQALHRAQQLLLPGLIAAQADVRYFDFARVYFIGNGFFLREYYPDAAVSAINAKISVPSDEVLNESLDEAKQIAPVLGELFSSLVMDVPSFFASEFLFTRSTAEGRPRLFVVFDLD